MSYGEVHPNVAPRAGAQYMERPTHLDCKRCWPQHGWGHRPTRKGKQAWIDEAIVYTHHIKGPCLSCAGTGLVPIPMEEVFVTRPLTWTWDVEDANVWAAGK